MAPGADELNALTLCGLADAIRGGEVSAVEAMAATLARIERLDPKLNAFIWRDGAGAMARAAGLTGRPTGPSTGRRRRSRRPLTGPSCSG